MKVLYKSKDNRVLYIENGRDIVVLPCNETQREKIAGFNIPTVQDYAQAYSKFVLAKLDF